MKRLIMYGLTISLLTGAGRAMGQSIQQQATAPPVSMYLAIPDTTIILSVSPSGTPTFNNQAINNIIGQYNVTDFHQAFPDAREQYLREAYRLTCSSMDLGAALKAAFPLLFPYYEPTGEGELLLDYYPDEWFSGLCSTGYLDYIGAPAAWGITKGDPNTIIGVTDNYFDTTNPDLENKIFALHYNTNVPTAAVFHGTLVAGLAAGATDNDTLYPSMGFRCRLDLSSQRNHNEMRYLSEHGDRVLNASWRTPGLNFLTLNPDTLIYQQGIYNAIYENGTFTVVAAGNGYESDPANGPVSYLFPSSLNHNFSVTSIGWGNPNNGPGSFNVVDVHDKLVGYPDSSYQHNDRVDLCAPGLMIGGLAFDPNDPNVRSDWALGWGTSFAAPQVAGTAALILSENPCLTPYQVEYILKESAKKDIYDLPENQPYMGSTYYNGKLGAGKLEAGKALRMTDTFHCNNNLATTFSIEGIEINTICKPGSASNGVKPQLTPILKNGTPPYTYHWAKDPDNHTTLDNYDIEQPTVMTSYADNVAYYHLTVYDNSEIQKVADKTIRIQLTDAATYDLAMRDHYMDMMDEPNSMADLDPRIWDLWTSPDIWNRRLQDSGFSHENPEYFSTDPNYVYFRVRNIGCAPSPTHAYVRLYWTKASTGESWPGDWSGSTLIQGSGGLVQAGDQITTSAGIYIPVMQPGESVVKSSAWYPPDPHTFYGSPDEVDVCLLARIQTASSIPYGMTFPELTGDVISKNVRNNNNIVTRNMILTDFLAGNTSQIHWVDLNNAGSANGSFRLELINDRSINPHFSGDFSAVGYVTVYLGDLYDRWTRSGSHGSYAAIDAGQKSVTFDGSDSLWLGDIPINAGERFPVKLQFHLRSGVILNENEFLLHFRQFDQSDPKNVYGAVNFLVKTHADDQAQSYFVSNISQNEAGAVSVYPNPASNQLNIQLRQSKATLAKIEIYDVYGRMVLRKRQQSLGATVATIDIASLTPGVYFIKIHDRNGMDEEHKFVKK